MRGLGHATVYGRDLHGCAVPALGEISLVGAAEIDGWHPHSPYSSSPSLASASMAATNSGFTSLHVG